MKIQTIAPARSTFWLDPALAGTDRVAPAVYKAVDIRIETLSGFHQFGTFLSLAESAKIPMAVSSLRIWSDPRESKRVRTALLLRSFVVVGASSGAREGAL